MAAPRIVLVDDHALCRNGLTDLLTHRGGMEVLDALSDPDKLMAVLREKQPDLVGMAPNGHIFVDSKAPWFDVTDDLPQFAAMPPRR